MIRLTSRSDRPRKSGSSRRSPIETTRDIAGFPVTATAGFGAAAGGGLATGGVGCAATRVFSRRAGESRGVSNLGSVKMPMRASCAAATWAKSGAAEAPPV